MARAAGKQRQDTNTPQEAWFDGQLGLKLTKLAAAAFKAPMRFGEMELLCRAEARRLIELKELPCGFHLGTC